ncbi:MAG: DoxX family protein [Anaerolineales bacterium]|uniref:DoxX family protein n=1 Tax=Candidatus Desulfolinea nitratireducens TaxID=2841698 RepID=A0A8J6TER0_9CHLR|nr:DoxX family protein [Candidatus Desulfolinea nitratireducens]MBL6961433.1 DoxX family protein [Anaerolineales bacterium]
MNSIITKDDQRTPLGWVALLRIMLGILFLTTWGSNFTKGFYTPDGLQYFFTEVFPQSANSLGWYAAFIDNVILPIRGVFAPVQLVGEFLMGLFLLIGIFTPITSGIAAFFIINTFLATFGHDWPWSYVTILGILFVVFMTKSGRSLGLDAWLLKNRGEPKIPFLW